MPIRWQMNSVYFYSKAFKSQRHLVERVYWIKKIASSNGRACCSKVCAGKQHKLKWMNGDANVFFAIRASMWVLYWLRPVVNELEIIHIHVMHVSTAFRNSLHKNWFGIVSGRIVDNNFSFYLSPEVILSRRLCYNILFYMKCIHMIHSVGIPCPYPCWVRSYGLDWPLFG